MIVHHMGVPVNLWPNNEEQTSTEEDAERHTDGYSDQNTCITKTPSHGGILMYI